MQRSQNYLATPNHYHNMRILILIHDQLMVSKVAGYYLTKNYREAYKLFACSGILFNHTPRRNVNFVSQKIIENLSLIIKGKIKKLF